MNLSDGEKLIVLMLTDIYKALDIKGGFDPDFIAETIYFDHLWGFRWQYTGVPFSRQESPPVVKQTVDFLDMWSFIEQSISELSDADKEQLGKDTEPYGADTRFTGFDGNSEIEHMSVARYVVEHLKRFEGFTGREFNSHVPNVDRYARMYAAFEPMRPSLGDRWLDVTQLTKLLQLYRG